MQSNDNTLTVDISDQINSTVLSIDNNCSTIFGDIEIDGSIVKTISANPYYGQATTIVNGSNDLILGDSTPDGDCDIYICEEWESKKPIKIKDGMYASFKEDLYSLEEVQDMIYKKIEDEYPEKAIKIGTNKDNLRVRKHSLPIEIKMKD